MAHGAAGAFERPQLTMIMECVASDHRGVERTDSDRRQNSPLDTHPEFENRALRVILLPDAKTVHKVSICTTNRTIYELRMMLSRLKSRAGSKSETSGQCRPQCSKLAWSA